MIAGARHIPYRYGLLSATALALLSLAVASQAKPHFPVKHPGRHYVNTKRPVVEERPVFRLPNARLAAVNWAELDGWADDDHAAAFATFLVSCNAILKRTPEMRAGRPVYRALYDVCGKAVALPTPDAKAARAFFEQNFRPIRISPAGETDGFITGYYEPVVDGRRQADDTFAYPLYRKPPDLLPGGRMVGAVKTIVRKGKRIAKRLLVPFFDRARIEDGALAGRNLEICYLKDAVDAFFVHIQGSVRVKLDDGSILRLNYVAANGQPYTAVGKFLIERKILSRDEMSMEKIRQWMNANPEQGQQLRLRNKSYVFFRETGLAANQEPVGAEGVSLTPGRSIAVDHKLHVYGTPFFIQAELPIDSEAPATRFRRLMIAQDTGGAIVGPARADIYWGVGPEAGVISGRFKQPGKFVMLIPNAIDPFANPTDEVPLPRPRPAIGVVAVNADKAVAPLAPKAIPVAKTLAAPKKPEPKKTETHVLAKRSEPKKVELKKAEPRKAEPKKTEPNKKTEVKTTEPKSLAARLLQALTPASNATPPKTAPPKKPATKAAAKPQPRT